jgi:hypothetical protein
MLAAHADWSVDPRKRWIAVARQADEAWSLAAPQPVGEVATLLRRLQVQANGAAVALGLDLPLGLPRAYAALCPEPDFPTFLKTLAGRPDFFRVCATLAEVDRGRPFYPARGVAGMTRAAHAAALGLGGAAALSRACDRATAERPAGAPLFWTLGANQSGKAAIAAWRDLLLPALERDEFASAHPSRSRPSFEPVIQTSGRSAFGHHALGVNAPIRLWPYAGKLRGLLTAGAIVLAETYPAEAMRHLGIRLHPIFGGSKRRQADRITAAPSLLAAMAALGVVPDPALGLAIASGFGADSAGEDRFDCVLGVLCVINVLAGNRPDDAPPDPWIRRWEGWVLGQTAMPTDPAWLSVSHKALPSAL